MDYIRDEHRVHLIIYHLVFCPKRRKPVLLGDIKRDCERLITEKCTEKGWDIVEMAIMPDHVHLFVRVHPATSAAEVVKEIKGLTSHELRKNISYIAPFAFALDTFVFRRQCGKCQF